MKENLVPLAGRGQRFVNEGYKDPKPLIKVNGLPMVVTATRCLPKADSYTFLPLQEHIDNHHIDKVLKRYFKDAKIVPVKKLTEGQASTCLLAEGSIDPESILTIGACDNGMTYDPHAFEEQINSPDTDALIWTFRRNPNVLVNPTHWGWVKTDKKGFVKKVSVKVPISNDPINDHAVVGCFSFKKARYFFENAKEMVAANRRINGEFYNDECMNVLVENGLKVKVFEIDKYIGWGTPNDLRTYLYWQEYFKKTNEKS